MSLKDHSLLSHFFFSLLLSSLPGLLPQRQDRPISSFWVKYPNSQLSNQTACDWMGIGSCDPCPPGNQAGLGQLGRGRDTQQGCSPLMAFPCESPNCHDRKEPVEQCPSLTLKKFVSLPPSGWLSCQTGDNKIQINMELSYQDYFSYVTSGNSQLLQDSASPGIKRNVCAHCKRNKVYIYLFS
jgi:hypothetical protein